MAFADGGGAEIVHGKVDQETNRQLGAVQRLHSVIARVNGQSGDASRCRSGRS